MKKRKIYENPPPKIFHDTNFILESLVAMVSGCGSGAASDLDVRRVNLEPSEAILTELDTSGQGDVVARLLRGQIDRLRATPGAEAEEFSTRDLSLLGAQFWRTLPRRVCGAYVADVAAERYVGPDVAAARDEGPSSAGSAAGSAAADSIPR